MGTLKDSQAVKVDTVIIGGGISGLSCARRLFDAGKEFVLLSDKLGGRIHHSEKGYVFGAVIMTNDYTHIHQYATKARSMYPWSGNIWNGQKAINTMFLVDFKGVFRFSKVMKKFQQSMNRLRLDAPFTCQKELMEKDPLLKHLVEQSAAEFVIEHGLEKFNEQLLGPVANIVVFRSYKEINAFNYCIALLATTNGACYADFTQTVARLTRGYEGKIHLEKVISLQENEDGASFYVKAEENSYQACNVVIATPARNTADFYEKAPSDVLNNMIHVIHVKGKRRKKYKPGKSLTFKAGNDVECFFAQKDDFDILYATTPEPDFDRYYPRYEIVDRLSWKTGTQLAKDKWRPLQLKNNLFAIGDYNICGLEDSFLTGLFAANKIISN